MNRTQFINELKHKLRRLPHEEMLNAVSYYEEYFDEAGVENEMQTVVSLGSPAAVASKIIGEYAITSAELEESAPRKKSNILLITILAIFASPIALPIAISILMILFSVIMVFFSLFITGGALLIAGVATVFAGIWSFSAGFSTGLFYLGSALVMLGLGAAISLGTAQLGRLTLRALQKWMGKLLIRRGKS